MAVTLFSDMDLMLHTLAVEVLRADSDERVCGVIRALASSGGHGLPNEKRVALRWCVRRGDEGLEVDVEDEYITNYMAVLTLVFAELQNDMTTVTNLLLASPAGVNFNYQSQRGREAQQ